MLKKLDGSIHEDGITARCQGLATRTAYKKLDNSLVRADSITKDDGPFYCPVCLSDAIVRKCTEKVNHFAHKSRQSPLISAKDQELHNTCRDEIFNALKAEFPEGNWGKERRIEANWKQKGNKERIPDISGKIGKKGIAIEVQASAYTLNRIYEKTCDYHKMGIYVLWILPLRGDLGIEPFRPRLFEKYLHSLYFGRVYYCTLGSGTILQPVHYSPAKRYIEESEWYEGTGEQRTEGGYYLTYKTVKSPNYGQIIDIVKDFSAIENSGFTPKNAKKEIPKCSLFLDNLKKWWDEDEFNNVKDQIEVSKKKNEIFHGYNYFDDYDDYAE